MDGRQITLLLFAFSYFSFLLEISPTNGEIYQTTFQGKEIKVYLQTRYKYIFIDEAEVKKKYGFIRTSLNYLDIKIATEGNEKKIGDQFRQDPILLAKDILIAADNVINKKCANPRAMAMINYIIYEDTKAHGHCRLTISDELKTYNQLPFQMAFIIGNPIVFVFNEFFLRMNSAGMFDLYKKKYFPVTRKCRTDIRPETKTRLLTLFDLTFTFLIIEIGLK